METTKQKAATLNGKPLWKCSHSELTAYAKKHNITLATGLKTYQVASLVKKHLDDPKHVATAIDSKLDKLKAKPKSSHAAKGMESIKIWNLHKEKGMTPEQIEKELGHAAWYNKKTIERYAASETLQARAKEVHNAKK